MKKKTLLTSLLTIAMCLALIAGSTYALFTSEDKVDISVSSGKVNVTATVTNLVTYSMGEVTEVEGKFANGGTALFTTSDVKLLKLDRVTPGDKVTFTIELTNASTVDIQYRLTWNITGALSEALEINATDLDWTKWTTAEATTKTIDVTVELPAEFETQGLEDAAISFKVEAVQANAIVEEVATADQLWAALEMGVDHITLTKNITLAEGQVITVAEGATTEINLNGKTIAGVSNKSVGAVIKNNGELTITGGTISSTAANGGSAIQNNGTLTVINSTLNGASNADGNWPSYTVNNAGVMTVNNSTITSVHGAVASYGEGAVLTLNNTNIDMAGIPGFTSHGIYTYSGGKAVVNGGNIANNAADQNATGGSVINGNVVITGGNFTGRIENYYGTPVIYGGTFSVKPNANFIAEYFEAVEGNGTWSVVPEEGVTLVDDVQKLTTALTTAAAAGAGDSTVYLMGNIDLTDTAWTPIKVDGYHGAGIVTVEGNGATITGLTAPLFAGGFAGKSGIIIRNLTIADSTIAGGNQGGGAFIDTADSMQVITLENCHLVNSTVTGERVGGLLGWCSGYSNENDGPVKTYVTITNCSVIDCEIIGAGSAAGIAGHPGASDYTYTTIENCLVKDTTVHSNDDGGWRVGAIVGTANNGHVVINNCTAENVALSQIDKTAPAGQSNLFGRFVPSGTGTLVIDGANYVANAAALQAALDSAVTGTTIQLLPGVNYGALTVRPTANNETTMYCETHNFTTTDAEEFKAHLAESGYHTTPKYTTTFKDVTIIGAEGATISGMLISSGHIVGPAYDYVRNVDFAAGSVYYWTLNISNLSFEDVAFTGQVNINTSDATSVYDGVTFDGCSFTTGGTASANGAAIRYYNEANNGNVKNIVVNECTFTNCYQGIYVHHVNGVTVTNSKFDATGHNAIAMQGHDGAVALKNVVITGNTFDNIGDRVIRFNEVGADSNITIQNNTATNSGDDENQVMKATSIASGVTTSISGNNWNGGIVANDELKDN